MKEENVHDIVLKEVSVLCVAVATNKMSYTDATKHTKFLFKNVRKYYNQCEKRSLEILKEYEEHSVFPKINVKKEVKSCS